jgi:hypothetical protein
MTHVDSNPTAPVSEDPVQPIVQRPERTEFQRRRDRAAESILDNERLTSSMDDDAAKLMIDWGLSCTEQIVQSTVGMTDAEAEDVTYPRLRATRRLMRIVNRWIRQRHEMAPDETTALLGQVVQQAEVIYGERFVPPRPECQGAFAMLIFDVEPTEIIQHLREFIERPA